jgi:DNA primase catalytic core
MVSISKPLSATKIKQYYRSEYSSATSAYYTESATLRGEWHGKLAAEFGFEGQQVRAEHFDRLSEGQHPTTGEQLIKWRPEATKAEPGWKTGTAAWKEHLTAVYIDALAAGNDPLQPGFVAGDLRTADSGSAKKSLAFPEPKRNERQAKLIEIHAAAAEIYRENLAGPMGAEARRYLQGRGITPELAKEFGLGLSAPGNQLSQRLAHYDRELLEASGLFADRGGKLVDRQRGRVMFPIQDTRGDVVAFAGRNIGDRPGPKYINSPATEIYNKSEILYNAHRAKDAAREAGKVVVVEGYTDVIAAHGAGVRNVVAPCGTALTEQQADLLARMAPAAVLNLDPDSAGTKATSRHLPVLLEKGLDVSVLSFASGDDPAEMIQKERGAEYYRMAVESRAEPLLSWAFEAARAEQGDVFARVDAARDVIEMLQSVPPEKREAFAEDWARYLHVPVPERSNEKEPVAHRAGWDLTFSAPKSVSLAGLVGGDERIIEAHRAAVRAALQAAEDLVQARMGGYAAPQTTGNFVVAAFDHDTARPVEGYAAPQLHTHCVVMNMTEDQTGQARSLQTRELYVAAPMLTAVYQNALELQLREFGYKIERGKNHAPEIAGFSPEYLAAESQRSEQIAAELEAKGMVGAGASSIAAHAGREEKLNLSPAEIKAMHLKKAEEFGNQPQRIVAEASQKRRRELQSDKAMDQATKAVDFARAKLSERSSVFEHHEILTEALRNARGRTGLSQIRAEVERQTAVGEFIPVQHIRPHAPLWRYTTPELIENERACIEKVLAGRATVWQMKPEKVAGLNEDQQRVVDFVAASRDQIIGISGKAGTGKTTALRAIRELAEAEGYQTQGLGPTSKATAALREAGLESKTLQRFLVQDTPGERKRMFFLDESSLASGKQVREFLERLRPGDRAILVGDERQHDSVEAGRIFGELQGAGMRTETLSKIIRQKEPGLLEAVEALSRGDVKAGVGLLGDQGRITSVGHREERFQAIARDYARQPEATLVVSPDNNSRRELNAAIREELRAQGQLSEDVYKLRILVNRQNVTGADRAVASSYAVGDEVRYRKGSAALGIEAGDYATVVSSDHEANRITVKRADGKLVTYDPEKLRGVSIYEPEVRALAVGDRIQFTAPSRSLSVANRETGTISSLDQSGNIRVALDAGRTVSFSLQANKHVDHAYAVTSHSSQGATVDRVLVHIDTGDSRVQKLINDTLAYVALSRPRHDARIYTDDEAKLTRALNRHVENATALAPEQVREYQAGVAA